MKTTIIGYEKELKELKKVIDVINHAQDYIQKGLFMPKGLLIKGNSGNGKSLFSNYLIENVNKPIFKIKISDLGSNYPEAIRSIYNQAREVQGGAIVIIDELDKLLGDQYSFQGLDFKVFSELLQELDKTSEVFTVLMAISDHVIPQQLIRSGRIDITIGLNSPSQEERKALVRHYIHPLHYIPEDLEYIAQATNHLSCAELENISKLASMNAITEHKESISTHHFESALNQVFFKGMPKQNQLTQEQLNRVAVHEVGHAIMAHHINPEKLQTISIEQYEQTLGHVRVRNQAVSIMSEEEYKEMIYIALSGRAIEKLYFNNTSTGSQKDIEYAYKLVRNMLSKFSFQNFKYLKVENYEGNYDPTSERNRQKLENKITRLMNRYQKEVEHILMRYYKYIPNITGELIHKKVLYRQQFQSLISNE